MIPLLVIAAKTGGMRPTTVIQDQAVLSNQKAARRNDSVVRCPRDAGELATIQKTDEADKQTTPADNPARVMFGYVGETCCDHDDEHHRKSDEQKPPYSGSDPLLNFRAVLLLRIGNHNHFPH